MTTYTLKNKTLHGKKNNKDKWQTGNKYSQHNPEKGLISLIQREHLKVKKEKIDQIQLRQRITYFILLFEITSTKTPLEIRKCVSELTNKH